MEPAALISFSLVAAAFIVIPGPNILVIISTSLVAGKARGLQTVAGVSLAMAIQLLVAALATGWLLTLVSRGLKWLKWGGVAYLAMLGCGALYRWYRGIVLPVPSAQGSFRRGFWVSLTNPKTILFFSAFLPQFIVPAEPYASQFAILSAQFLVLAVVIDSGYALLAAHLRWLLQKHDLGTVQNGLSATLYLAASGMLAGIGRT